MAYVIVTGAYGGIGRSVVSRLSNSGFKVFALDKKVEESMDNNIYPVECNIEDIESIKNAFNIINSITDSIYAIMHFAGVYYLDSLIEIEQERFERIFRINVFGVYLINKTFIPLLHDNSRILITTSELAPLDPLPFTGIYGITKTTLDKYSYSLRMELQLKNIWVSVIRPGAVKTKLLDDSTSELDKFCEKTSMYNISSNNFRDIVNKVEAKNITPDRLSKLVLKVINKKKPKFNYNINRNKLLILLNILPKSLRFKIIKKILNKK